MAPCPGHAEIRHGISDTSKLHVSFLRSRSHELGTLATLAVTGAYVSRAPGQYIGNSQGSLVMTDAPKRKLTCIVNIFT